ncbi:sensor histidine kinase [Candidatus Latescibacterota bacterium]
MKSIKLKNNTEFLLIKNRHLENQNEVIKQEYEKTTEEYLKILVEISKANRQLKKEIAQRKKAEKQLKISLSEKETLLREIHHRVKNNLQVIAGLLMLQTDRIKDKDFQNLFQESINRINTMGLIHTLLYQSDNFSHIHFGDYMNTLCKNIQKLFSIESYNISLKTSSANIMLNVDRAIPCGLIINELVSNSYKYAFPDYRKGEITISLKKKEKQQVRTFNR